MLLKARRYGFSIEICVKLLELGKSHRACFFLRYSNVVSYSFLFGFGVKEKLKSKAKKFLGYVFLVKCILSFRRNYCVLCENGYYYFIIKTLTQFSGKMSCQVI